MVARSPNYPVIDLATALAQVEKAFKAENRNKMSRLVLAKHLGYNSLNGRSLGMIGAVRAYGLIDGRADELRISDDAVTALMAPGGSPDRKAALERLASEPGLFKQMRADNPGSSLPSEENIKFQLVKRGFTSEAAGKAAKNYLATMRLVSENPEEYHPSEDQEDAEMQDQPFETNRNFGKPVTPPVVKAGMLQEVFTLEEGSVTVTFPSTLSAESYQDLEDHLKIFMRKAKRRAGGNEEAAN